MQKRLLIILGDQLFPKLPEGIDWNDTTVFMAESSDLAKHYRYHKQKIALFFSAMRHYQAQLKEDKSIHYCAYESDSRSSFLQKLANYLLEHPQIEAIHHFEVDDLFFEKELTEFCRQRSLAQISHPSPKFLYDQDDFQDYLASVKKPFLKTYYQRKREQSHILLDSDSGPLHGKWSFDEDNRKKLPKDIIIPPQAEIARDEIDRTVLKLIDQEFPDHPGSLENFNWATTREEALKRLDYFVQELIGSFGPYEDAIHPTENFLFHSTLSPYLNIGLITPQEVLDAVLERVHDPQVPYSSIEGFVRQLMGWREFIRGMYRNYDFNGNHFQHLRGLNQHWYAGTTGITPLDDSIKKAQAFGYNHHIERLMVIGNLMLLSEIHPQEVYRWFMEMYVDSADWVMVPNVLGMSQFADGGIFATKPYICGSNYLRKMSSYPKAPWCEIMDGLYWRFIDRNIETFAKNQRMSMMVATLKRMNPEKREHIFSLANQWIDKNTRETV